MSRRTTGSILARTAGIALAVNAIPAGGAIAASAPRAPHATTGAVTHTNQTSAALNGSVSPHGAETTCYFQYGTTTAYGSQTPAIAAGSGTTGVKVTQPLTGLQVGTTYHYRLIATSANGTSEGLDRSFTTRQTPLRFVVAQTGTVQVFGSRLTLTGTLSGTGGAGRGLALQTNPFPFFAGFADVGPATNTSAEGAFSLTLPSFAQTTEVRVRTLDALPTYSRIVTVHVAPLVTLHARATREPGTVHLTGTVAPAEDGVTVFFQRVPHGRAPLTVAKTTARAAGAYGSRFAATVRVHRGGDYRALVKISNGRQVAGASTTVKLRGAPRKARHKRHH